MSGSPSGARRSREAVMVLVGQAARSRRPAATQWRVLEYDPVTRLPAAELGARWEPATTSGEPLRVTRRVIGWAGQLVGHPVRADRSAEELAGPGSWHLDVDPSSTSGGQHALG